VAEVRTTRSRNHCGDNMREGVGDGGGVVCCSLGVEKSQRVEDEWGLNGKELLTSRNWGKYSSATV
jgi:hypothetical protein